MKILGKKQVPTNLTSKFPSEILNLIIPDDIVEDWSVSTDLDSCSAVMYYVSKDGRHLFFVKDYELENEVVCAQGTVYELKTTQNQLTSLNLMKSLIESQLACLEESRIWVQNSMEKLLSETQRLGGTKKITPLEESFAFPTELSEENTPQ